MTFASRVRSLSASTLLAFVMTGSVMSPLAAQDVRGSDRWEKDIRKFEADIKSGRSKPGSVMFIGSSSIRLWDLPRWFPNHQAINHGFGGSEVADSLHFFDRIVKPLRPSMILMYAGDNDIAKGKTAEVVHRDFTSFVAKVKADLPNDTKVGYIAIKPSLKRWNLSEEMGTANALIADDCKTDDQLVFIDIWTPMLGKDGRPRPELFAKDGLHLSDNGYQLWSSIVSEQFMRATTDTEN